MLTHKLINQIWLIHPSLNLHSCDAFISGSFPVTNNSVCQTTSTAVMTTGTETTTNEVSIKSSQKTLSTHSTSSHTSQQPSTLTLPASQRLSVYVDTGSSVSPTQGSMTIEQTSNGFDNQPNIAIVSNVAGFAGVGVMFVWLCDCLPW